MSENTIINKIPSPTWNWLKLNDAKIETPELCAAGEPQITVPSNVLMSSGTADVFNDIKTGCGDQLGSLIENSIKETTVFTIEADQCSDGPVVIKDIFNDGENVARKYAIVAKENSAITILMQIGSDKDSAGKSGISTLIKAEKGAKVNLIQIDLLGKGRDLYNDIGATVEESGIVCIHHLFLGGGNIYQGCNVALEGDESRVEKEIGYFLSDGQKLDMNYVVEHRGKRSECDIKTNGVLSGNAEKLFRGTIDFRDGCAGSKGNEIEEVILRDDSVINKTIPVILCEEEDVEGNHGATIGRLDEDLIFYLESRGLSEEEIYRLIAHSRLTAFCRKIPNDDIRQETFNFISE